jgi:hypothetical protein
MAITVYHAKVNKKVWEFMNFLVNDRFQCKDGNFILWQADLVNIGSKLGLTIDSDIRTFLEEVCEQIGAVLLTLKEAKEEQDGKVTRTLPVAEDVRFQLEGSTGSTAAKDEPASEEEVSGQEDSSSESEEGDAGHNTDSVDNDGHEDDPATEEPTGEEPAAEEGEEPDKDGEGVTDDADSSVTDEEDKQ